MKMRVQAQHLKPGDIVGSGERVENIILNSIKWPSSKVCVILSSNDRDNARSTYWGKRTMINVERAE